MLLREYLEIFAKRFWILLLIVVIVLLGTYFFTKGQKDNYAGSLTVYTLISPQQLSANDDFKFDNFPTLGRKPNYKRLKELGKKGIKDSLRR